MIPAVRASHERVRNIVGGDELMTGIGGEIHTNAIHPRANLYPMVAPLQRTVRECLRSVRRSFATQRLTSARLMARVLWR